MTIVSGLAFLGIVVLPCIKKEFYEKVLIILTGLGIGSNNYYVNKRMIDILNFDYILALISDAVLHIIPQIFHLENKSDENSKLIKDFVPYCCLIIACMIVANLNSIL